MKKRIISLILVLVLVICALPVSAFAFSSNYASEKSPSYGICTGNGVRIRSSATTSTTGNIIRQIDKNQAVEIIGTVSTEWYKVRYDRSGSVGYVSSSYLVPTSYQYGYVIQLPSVDMKNIYDTKSNDAYTICSIPYGTYMPYNNQWYVNSDYSFHCLCGMTAGWIKTEGGYSFKYMELN